MKKNIVCFLLLIALQSGAQENGGKQKNAFRFRTTLQGGLLMGAAKPASQLQAINGLQYKTWSGGIGIGLDHYFVRTAPLFATLQKDIFNRYSTPYVYAAAGTQFMWPRSEDKLAYGQQDFNGGLYYNVGAGYKLSLAKKHAFLLSTGYSVKKFDYGIHYVTNCLVAPCPEYKNETEYILRRLSFQVGFLF